MHLLDMPKPKRSARPPVPIAASVLLGACLAVFFLVLLSSYVGQQQYESLYAAMKTPAKETSPVKYVTVTIPIPQKDSSGGIHLFLDTHKMPLIELYDELCWVETDVKKKTLAGKMTPAAEEQLYRSYEKVFKYKYSLTPPQVAMIKREGSRLKQETGTERLPGEPIREKGESFAEGLDLPDLKE